MDIKGNQSAVQTKRVLVGAREETGTVGGTVPATLAADVGRSGPVPAVHAGCGQHLHGVDDANVISTAGDATLSVIDPSPTNTGHLVNGAFVLPPASPSRASA